MSWLLVGWRFHWTIAGLAGLAYLLVKLAAWLNPDT